MKGEEGGDIFWHTFKHFCLFCDQKHEKTFFNNFLNFKNQAFVINGGKIIVFHCPSDNTFELVKFKVWKFQQQKLKLLITKNVFFRHNVFNLYQVIYRGGVVLSYIYVEPFAKKFYAEVLAPKLGAALEKLKVEQGFVPTVVHHDNCLNGKKDTSALDKHIGRGVRTTYTGKHCNTKIGEKLVKCYHRQCLKKGRLKMTQRRPVNEPCDPCQCNFHKDTVRKTATQAPANCPHLSLQELPFNQQLQIVQKNHKNGSFPWGPGADLKRKALEAAIIEFDKDKNWFKEAYKFRPDRWQAVVDANGYVPSSVKDVPWGSKIWRKKYKNDKK